MPLGNIIAIYVSAVGMMMQVRSFARYARLRGKQLHGLGILLAMFAVLFCIILFTAVGFFLPEGEALYRLCGLCYVLSAYFYVMIIHFFVRVSGGSRRSGVMALLLYLVPAVVLVMALAPGMDGLLLDGVRKAADGFGYEPLGGPVIRYLTLYQNLMALVCIVVVLRFDRKLPARSRKMRWVFVAVVLLPTLLGLGQVISEQFLLLRLSVLLSWLPIEILAYLFYGYLFTSRPMAIQAMDEMYLVFDLFGMCVDYNDRAQVFIKRHLDGQIPTMERMARLMGTDNPAEAEGHTFQQQEESSVRYYRADPFPIGNGLKQYCGNGLIISEITDLMQRVNHLSDLATLDPLTGAKNRRYFDDYARKALERASLSQQPVTLLMLDLDLFKQVNDRYGHLVGDEVLKSLCRICQQSLRKDDVLCRFGGEEFVVLCAGAGNAEAASMAERIRMAICREPFMTSEGPIPVTVSIGAYTFVPGQNADLQALLDTTDEYLYKAKQSGRNRVEHRAMEPLTAHH